jgi:hypothetical protein
VIVFDFGHVCFEKKIQQQKEEAEMEKFLKEKKFKGNKGELLG